MVHALIDQPEEDSGVLAIAARHKSHGRWRKRLLRLFRLTAKPIQVAAIDGRCQRREAQFVVFPQISSLTATVVRIIVNTTWSNVYRCFLKVARSLMLCSTGVRLRW